VSPPRRKVRDRPIAFTVMTVAMRGAAALPVAAIVDEPLPWVIGLVLFGAGAAVYTRAGTPHGPPVDVTPPVRGRWKVVNSPATRVPSHGVHAWAQTYAVDLVHDPVDGSRPSPGWWLFARPPDAFPGFGEPVFAPISGEVVRGACRRARPSEPDLAAGAGLVRP
jgi:hypothetical protein